MIVGEMQRRLSRKAEQQPLHKFGDLFSLVHNRDWLYSAWESVRANRGSVTAGCDGLRMSDFEADLDNNIYALSKEIKSGRFQAHPARRAYIPKSDGRQRPLGIPTIRDRIVQEAVRMVLEPIYEAQFSQYSYGFRPNRRTMDAIKRIIFATSELQKFFWVLDADISSYFDNVNHRKLTKLLRKRVADDHFIDLVWSFLRAGVMENKLFKDTKLGTPQGGIVSPLLANIYLHELDQFMEDKYLSLPSKVKTKRRRQGYSNFIHVRYADDFVILANGKRTQTESVHREVKDFLKSELRLELSDKKTEIRHLNDGFNFVGFWMQRMIGRDGTKTTKVLIPDESVQRVKDKIDHLTDRTTHQDSVNSKLIASNQIIRGWCNYYKYASTASSVFNDIGHHQFWCMAHWLGRKYQLTMPQVMSKFRSGNTFATADYRMIRASEFGSQRYTDRFKKPNPFTNSEAIWREELPMSDTYWTGYEARPGMADLRPVVLRRDEYVCQSCGKQLLSPQDAHVDHIKPVHRFHNAEAATYLENLQTLCRPCHGDKTTDEKVGGWRAGCGESRTPGSEKGMVKRP